MKKLERLMYSVMAGALMVLPSVAHATPTSFTLPDLPMGQIYTLGGTILAGLAVMWGFRKIVKTTNRS